MIADLADCEVFLVCVVPSTRKLIENCQDLKVIVKYGVGTYNIDIDKSKEKAIRVDNAPFADAGSEQIVALIMACARAIQMTVKAHSRGYFQTKGEGWK